MRRGSENFLAFVNRLQWWRRGRFRTLPETGRAKASESCMALMTQRGHNVVRPPSPTTRKPQESICHFCHGKRQRTARREREGERGERTDCNTAKVVNSFFSAVGGRSLPENARPVCHGGGSDAPPHLSLWIIMIGQRDGLSYPASPSGRARSIAG